MSDSVRERIATCTELALLDVWLERSRTVTRAEDLFAEESGGDVSRGRGELGPSAGWRRGRCRR
ncbi:hypothetical protein [Streptomyces sp. SID10815]|uniref:hypothetical protein n=1 Tax=Streptomyces sp. SID10815 TaxID=2706027 RepID=UPI0013CA8EE6|nr:hypothetical protein [Streptomyces sp. SID10815]NEA52182.1 hypothetical protein [Streptomyces sp. SID10815]